MPAVPSSAAGVRRSRCTVAGVAGGCGGQLADSPRAAALGGTEDTTHRCYLHHADGTSRTPAESDITRHLGVSADELRHARRAELALQPSSLDSPLASLPGTGTLADCLGEQDLRIEHVLGMNAVAAHWGELPPSEQKILLMDFYGGMPQIEIGRRLGISQMHVSRLRAHAAGGVPLEEHRGQRGPPSEYAEAGAGASVRSGQTCCFTLGARTQPGKGGAGLEGPLEDRH